MKKLWISVAILGCVIGLLILNSIRLSALIDPLYGKLEEASSAAQASDWETADRLWTEAHDTWNEEATYLHFVQCHTITDEITTLLHEAKVYLFFEDKVAYSAASTHILDSLSEIKDLEEFSLGNLF